MYIYKAHYSSATIKHLLFITHLVMLTIVTFALLLSTALAQKVTPNDVVQTASVLIEEIKLIQAADNISLS